MSNLPIQPLLPQTLDFSNVGRTLTFGAIEPPPLFHEEGSIEYVEHREINDIIKETYLNYILSRD